MIFQLKKSNKLWSLFTTFFRIGAFTFGGGYAMIPLIQAETVEKQKWVSDEDILEIVAIAESTPGPIAINSATFIGYRVAGVAGSLCATFGVVLPSFVIILLISYLLREFANITAVKYAFEGIRAGVLALIVGALYKMFKKCPKNAFSYAVVAAAFVAAAFTDINVILVIACSALAGIISMIVKTRRGNK
ncbi:MAG: chromate transporter [Clostridia bacterium]|nr:chromate transporter [Clostridia bacterium]